MKIELAKHSGFCFGVKRAMKMADDALQNKGKEKVYSLGPIIHNSQVVKRLKGAGLDVIDSLDSIKSGKVLIRCHGVNPKLLNKSMNRKFKIIDATCPFVRNSHRIAGSLSHDGYILMIVGDKDHPEIKSTMGFFDGDVIVIRDEKDAMGIRLKGKRVGVIAQTTQSKEDYSNVICELMKKDLLEIRVYNTICPDAVRRQGSCREVAGRNDLMLIVGGKNSANTKRLFEICKEMGVLSYHVEDASQIDPAWFKSAECSDSGRNASASRRYTTKRCYIRDKVGIISGASTPDWVVDEVIKMLKNIDNNKRRPSGLQKEVGNEDGRQKRRC